MTPTAAAPAAAHSKSPTTAVKAAASQKPTRTEREAAEPFKSLTPDERLARRARDFPGLVRREHLGDVEQEDDPLLVLPHAEDELAVERRGPQGRGRLDVRAVDREHL